MDLTGVDVLGEGVVIVVLGEGVGVVVVMVVLSLVEKVVEVMEWFALLCLPRTLRSFLLCLSSSILLSIAGSPGLPIFSLKSILGNTGALGGGWAWTSGSTYPTPGPPILSSMLSSSESSTTRRGSSSPPRVMTRGSSRAAAKSSWDTSRTRTSSSTDSCASCLPMSLAPEVSNKT